MACCLSTPSHSLNQCWVGFSSVRFCVIYLRAISLRVTKLLFCIKSFKMIILKVLPYLLRASELSFLKINSAWQGLISKEHFSRVYFGVMCLSIWRCALVHVNPPTQPTTAEIIEKNSIYFHLYQVTIISFILFGSWMLHLVGFLKITWWFP